MSKLGAAVTVVVALMLSGCALPAPTSDKPTVLTTFTVLADIARNVAGDRLQVESITKAGSEIHGYEPTPGDIRRAAKADLILDNGLNLEAWFAKFVAGIDVPHVVATQGIAPIPIAADAYAGKPNPHAWMSPLNVRTYVDNMVRAFINLDPAGRDHFTANAKRYQRQLDSVQQELTSALHSVPAKQRALVTCEGAFSYLARDAGLVEQYIWPVNAEQQATPGQIAGTIEFVRSRQVPAVFCESTVSDAPMRQVVSATGAKLAGVLYVDSLSEADGPVPTYLDLLRHDVRTIVNGLTGNSSTGSGSTGSGSTGGGQP